MYSIVMVMALSNGQSLQPRYPTNDPKCYCSCWGGPGCFGWSNYMGSRVCSGTYSGFYPGTQRGDGGGGGCHGGYSGAVTGSSGGIYFEGRWYPSPAYLHWGTLPDKTIPPATVPGPVKRIPAKPNLESTDEKPAPTPEKLDPAPKKVSPDPDKANAEDTQRSLAPEAIAAPKAPALGNQAGIIISLPADAKLTLDGEPTNQSTETRYFLTPPLDKGKSYQYQLRANVVRDGQQQVVTRFVQVRPGEISHVVIDFSRAEIAASR